MKQDIKKDLHTPMMGFDDFASWESTVMSNMAIICASKLVMEVSSSYELVLCKDLSSTFSDISRSVSNSLRERE